MIYQCLLELPGTFFKAALIVTYISSYEFCHSLFFDASGLMYISEMVELNHRIAAQTVPENVWFCRFHFRPFTLIILVMPLRTSVRSFYFAIS